MKIRSGRSWVSGRKGLLPFIRQVEWPQKIQDEMVTEDNPTGSITVNDIELAGLVLNWLALECSSIPIKLKHIGTFCDNESVTSWAYTASSLTPLHIAGVDNC